MILWCALVLAVAPTPWAAMDDAARATGDDTSAVIRRGSKTAAGFEATVSKSTTRKRGYTLRGGECMETFKRFGAALVLSTLMATGMATVFSTPVHASYGPIPVASICAFIDRLEEVRSNQVISPCRLACSQRWK